MPALKTWISRLGKALACLLLVLTATGYFYERRADAEAARGNLLKGKLVDVGGYRLHLDCQGSEAPTVVLDSGFLDSLEQWDKVQPEVAKFTRTCSYDRAGIGWSDIGPKPRTAEHQAIELHTLLNQAGEHSPFVLVGHSYSGLIARMFASMYPTEVRGIVLDDVVAPEEMTEFPPERSVIPSYQIQLIRIMAPFGLPRLIGLCNPTGAKPDCPRFITAEMDNLVSYGESHAEVNRTKDLGDLPLAILAHDPNVGLSGRRDEAFEAAWARWQRNMMRLSTASTFVEAVGVGHEIQTDKPTLVIEAIARVVSASR